MKFDLLSAAQAYITLFSINKIGLNHASPTTPSIRKQLCFEEIKSKGQEDGGQR